MRLAEMSRSVEDVEGEKGGVGRREEGEGEGRWLN
jgi:hypothetical protein